MLNDQFKADKNQKNNHQYKFFKNPTEKQEFELFRSAFLVGMKQGLHDGHLIMYELLLEKYNDAQTLDDFHKVFMDKEQLTKEFNKMICNCTLVDEQKGVEIPINLAKE